MKRRTSSAGCATLLAVATAAVVVLSGAATARADFANVTSLAGQVVNLSSKVANGMITAAEQATLNAAKAALAGQNNVLNDLGLLGVKGGGIDGATYGVCQQAYVETVMEIVKQKAAEQGVTVEVQAKPVGPDGTVKATQAGADLDVITDAKSPETVKTIMDNVNTALKEYTGQGGKGASANLLQTLNIDIMVKPEGVTAEQFETIAGLNNDSYKTKGAALYEAAMRADPPGPVDIPNALDYAGEMLAFGAKKNNLAAVLQAELVKLEGVPDTKVPGTPAYEFYKTVEATYIKATHLEQKYINRLGEDVRAIAQATGVEAPPSSSLPAAGADRVPGQPGKAFAGNALSDALIQQQVKNLAEVLSGQGAKNPAAAGPAFQQAAGFAQILPDSAKGQLIDEVRAKYGDAAAKNLADAFKKIPSSTTVGFTPAPGGIFGDGSFKMTDTQLGGAGTALTAAGHLMLLLEAAKVAGTMAGQIENENYVGAAGTAGGFAASTWLTIKAIEAGQGGVAAWAPGLAPYLPALMAGMMSFGLTSQILEGITTADGKTLNEHIQDAMAGYAQEFEQVDVAGTAAEADQQRVLIKLVKSGFYKPKNGMTVAQAWQALSSGKALKDVLQPTFIAPVPGAAGVPAANAADVKQAAWEKAVADGLLKPDQYELFEKGYNPVTGRYTPPKQAGPPPFAGNGIIGTNDFFLGRGQVGGDTGAGRWTFGRPDGTMYSVDWNGNVEELPFPASAPWWKHPGLHHILGEKWGAAPPGCSTDLRPQRDRQSGWVGLEPLQWLQARLVRDGLALPDGSDGPVLTGAGSGRSAQTGGPGPAVLPPAAPAAPAPVAREAAEKDAIYEAQVAAMLAAVPAAAPPAAAPAPTAASAGYAAAIEQALKTPPAAPPAAAPKTVATPPPAVSAPVRAPAPRPPVIPAPAPAPPVADANVIGTWSRQEANIRETVTFSAGGSGSSKLVILDARVRGYVGDTVTPFSYSVSGNRVTVRTPSGAATGTVSGNSLSIGGKTYHR